jgi:hypothetical protein
MGYNLTNDIKIKGIGIMNRNVENYLASKEVENKQEETKIKSLITFLKETTDMVKSGSKEALRNAKTFLSEKGDSIKEYLSNFNSPLSHKAMQSLLALLLAVSLMISIAGCGNSAGPNGGTQPPVTFEQLEERPIEEIEETGIRAEDVLAAYDAFVTKIYQATNYKRQNGNVSNFTAQFTSLSTQGYEISEFNGKKYEIIEEGNHPYFRCLPDYDIVQKWINMPEYPYYKENIQTLHNIYPVQINYIGTTSEYSEIKDVSDFGISQEAMEDTLNTFNVKKTYLTQDLANQTPEPVSYFNYINTELYNKFEITRETIENATEDQLWQLYEMLVSLNTINFENRMPNESELIKFDENIKQ